MITVLITFPCLHSKKGTNLENGMFWNKATEGTTTPQSRERKQRKQRCRIAKILPSPRFSVNKIIFRFKNNFKLFKNDYLK